MDVNQPKEENQTRGQFSLLQTRRSITAQPGRAHAMAAAPSKRSNEEALPYKVL